MHSHVRVETKGKGLHWPQATSIDRTHFPAVPLQGPVVSEACGGRQHGVVRIKCAKMMRTHLPSRSGQRHFSAMDQGFCEAPTRSKEAEAQSLDRDSGCKQFMHLGPPGVPRLMRGPPCFLEGFTPKEAIVV